MRYACLEDIKLNPIEEGTVESWKTGEEPLNKWTPIGTKGKKFSGTFDGQGHTISGLYMKSNGNYLGLFGLLASNGKSVVKNFKLTNTYFENTGTGTGTSIGLGSVAGQGQGRMQDCARLQ